MALVDKTNNRVDKLILLFTLSTVLASFTSAAQTNAADKYHYDYISVEDGLPNENIDGLFQDDKGFVWICSFGGGLARYDGKSFVKFSTKTQTPLRNSLVTESCQDRFDRMWVTTAAGIDIIDMNTLKLCELPEGIRKSTEGRFCNFVMQDSKGCIWYNTADIIYRVSFDDEGSIAGLDSLKCTESGADQRFAFTDVDGDGSIWTSIDGLLYKIYGEKGCKKLQKVRILENFDIGKTNKASSFLRIGNDIWISTGNGLYCHNQIDGTSRLYMEGDNVTGLLNTEDGRLIASTLKGIAVYNSFNADFDRITSDTDVFGNRRLSNNMVRSLIAIGSQIWVGTEHNGITILRPNQTALSNIQIREPGSYSLMNTPVQAIHFDRLDQLWAGSMENGLFLFDRNSSTWKKFDYKSGMTRNSIQALCEDEKGGLWVGAIGGGVNRVDIRNPKKIETIIADNSELAKNVDNIYHLTYDSLNDYMWICSRAGLYWYDIKKSEVHKYHEVLHQCRSAAIDSGNRLWVLDSKGVTAIDLNEMSTSAKLPIGFCTAITVDNENNIWIGGGNGLYKYTEDDKGGYTLENYGSEKGLSGDMVNGILFNGNYLWATTDNGISRLSLHNNEIENLTSSNGLLTPGFCTNAIARSQSGALYFGHQRGISILWSDYIPTHSQAKELQLTFTRGLIGNKGINMAYQDVIRFHEKEPVFVFEFADLSFEQHDNITYECRIYPLDKEWRGIGDDNRSIRYDGLPGGNYELQLRAVDSAREIVPGGEAEIDIVVTPFFYRTTCFYIGIGILCILAAIGIINMKTKAIRRQNELIQKEVDLKTKQLSEQKRQLELKTEELMKQNEILMKQNEQIAGHKMILSNEAVTAPKETKFKETIMDKISELYKDSDLNIEILCKAMGMSRSVLNNKVQEAFGQSIGQFIRTYRLTVAKEIICNGKIDEISISEIAYDVGFNDPKYFTRCFSREFGTAPSAMLAGRREG